MKCSFNKEQRFQFNSQEMHPSEKRIHSEGYFEPPSESKAEREFNKRVINLYDSLHHIVIGSASLAIEREFKELSQKWKDETGLYSTPMQKVNDTYLEIIAKGKPYVPLILKDLQKGGSFYWHIALKAITGQNPVPNNDLKNSKVVKTAWIEWGKRNKLI